MTDAPVMRLIAAVTVSGSSKDAVPEGSGMFT